MTPANMAKHRNNPNMPFWKMLKEGYDHFEVTRHRAEGRRLREALRVQCSSPDNATPPLEFQPAPANARPIEVPQDIAAAVHDKQRKDEIQTAQLMSRGTPGRSDQERPRRRHASDLRGRAASRRKSSTRRATSSSSSTRTRRPACCSSAAYSSAAPDAEPTIALANSGTDRQHHRRRRRRCRARAAAQGWRDAGRALVRRPTGQLLPAGQRRARPSHPSRVAAVEPTPATAERSRCIVNRNVHRQRQPRRRSPSTEAAPTRRAARRKRAPASIRRKLGSASAPTAEEAR